MIHFLNQIAIANNSRPPHKILSIFCDLSKAFDVLDHSILLYKLSNLGIRGIAYTWLNNYLTNRTQYVTIEQEKSATLSIKTGVPQGSILGPLLFLIYVNDIHASTSSKILSFADDTTIIVQSTNQNSLIQKANDTLSEIDTWFCSNRLFLNLTKTKFMIISPHQTSIKKDLTQLSIRNNAIDRSSSHKFLGLHIDEHLTWKTHISHLNSKIAHALYTLKQVKNTLPTKALRTIYFSIIHPHVLYGITAWGVAASSTLDRIYKLF